MKVYLIVIGDRANPRIRMHVMAPDSITAQEQHICLVQPGERMEVRRA